MFLISLAVSVLLGPWGGAHVSLELTAQGGTVEFDCAHGQLTRPVVPNRNGAFDVPGLYVEEHGGPVREDAAPRSIKVRYSGRLKAGKMTLTVSRADNKKRIATFSLEPGREPFIVKCR